MVKEIRGDIIKLFKTGEFDAIIHNCNCCHDFDQNDLSKQIKSDFIKALRVDEQKTLFGCYQKLGTFSVCNAKPGKIINLYTHILPGANTEYAALVKGIHRINKHYRGKKIAINQITKNETQWIIISNIIKNLLVDVDLTIVYDSETNPLDN
jgi:O-acetyl-ADP-ribose deacetylase (regulator of RNase III)